MTKDVKTTNKNINSLLCEINKKVNAMATLTPIIKSESDKIDETGRNSVIGKVLSFVEGKVEASAAWSNCWSYTDRLWWGTRYFYSQCASERGVRFFRELAGYLDNGLGGAGVGSGFASHFNKAKLNFGLVVFGAYNFATSLSYKDIANKFEKSLWCNRGTYMNVTWMYTMFNACNHQRVN